MKRMNRRKVMAVVAAAAAIPVVATSASATTLAQENAFEKVRRLTAELEQAMREAYGTADVRNLSWGPHSVGGCRNSASPAVMLVAHDAKPV